MGIKPDIMHGAQRSNRDLKETNCVICTAGIFEGQPRVRVRQRYVLGPAHPECAPASAAVATTEPVPTPLPMPTVKAPKRATVKAPKSTTGRCRVCPGSARLRADGRLFKHINPVGSWCDGAGRLPANGAA